MLSGLFGGRISGEKFILAVKNNDLATVQNYISENRGNAMAINRLQTISPYYALIAAVQEGHVEIVRALLSVPGIDPNVSDIMDSNTPLITAASLGHTEIVEALLTAPHLNLVATNKNRNTAAQEAARQNHPAIARLITFEIRARALRKAAFNGQLDVVRKFINEHPNNCILFNARDRNGFTALSRAASKGHVTVVQALLAARDIDVNIADIRGLTALGRAAFNGHANCVTALLTKSEIDCNVVDMNGNTPLIHAAARGHTDTVQALLANTSINLAIENHQHLTAARAAVQNRHTGIVQLIERAEAAPPVSRFLVAGQERAFQRVLEPATISVQEFFNAICQCDLATVQAYIEAHRDDPAAMNVTNVAGSTALDVAVLDGNSTVVTALANASTLNVNQPDGSGYTYLMRAAKNGWPNTVTALLTFPRIEVNARDREGNTALYHCTRLGQETSLAVLLADSRVNLTLENNAGQTALQRARRDRHPNIVQMIEAEIARRAAASPSNQPIAQPAVAPNSSAATISTEQFLDAARSGDLATVQAYIAAHRRDPIAMNIRNEHGTSALHLAVLQGNFAVITALGAVSTLNVNLHNRHGYTPLMLAVVRASADVVSALLALPGIAVNARDNQSDTALHHCGFVGREDSLALLLADSRVNLTLENNAGQTPAQRARAAGHPNAAQMIEAEITRRVAAAPSNPSIAQPAVVPNPSAATISPQQFLDAARIGDLRTVQRYIAANRSNLESAMNVTGNRSGNTALIMAASAGQENIVNELLNTQGVNIDLQNRQGLNAAQAAQQYEHEEIAVRLMQLISARAVAPLPPAAPAVPKAPSPSPISLNFEQQLEAISYDGAIPDHLKCPISHSIMNDPIAVSSGQIYDRANLERWAAGRRTFLCPVTKLPIEIAELKNKTCIAIRTLIEKFVNEKVLAAERLKEEIEKQAAAQPPQVPTAAAPRPEPAPMTGPRLFDSSQINEPPEPGGPLPSP